ncbi:hypothetical protein [Psychroserpens mesophilus]|uniref:hypothetical protein n=1 Tax=Psychroserpens mesophilus TaxID=325473 RepID=UPI001F4CD377|nr:hypothetical protein [Psychroserpens mesophilus]
MEAIQQTNPEFYQQLGKLFFAIANADNSIRNEELKRLEEVLKTEWTDLNQVDTVAKNTIIETFKWLESDHEYDSDTCYTSFVNYKRAHESIFDNDIKSLIMKTAAKIASSYNSQNKSELIMLANLDLEFKRHTSDS